MFPREPNAAPDPSRRRADAVGWLRSLFLDLPLPPEATDEDLRAVVGNGRLLCALLRRLLPGALLDDAATDNAGRFRAAIQRMGVPTFSAYDLERGEMSAVVTCILALKDRFPSRLSEDHHSSSFLTRCDSEGSRRSMGGKLQRVLTSPIMSEPYSPSFGADAYSPSQVFQPKHGYSDPPGCKLSELMKSSSLENAPTQSLLGVVNSILDESIERKNGQIPYRIACLLRKVIVEIERRISTQAGHIRNQNNLIKAREEKYQSRIRVLEALAGGASGQTHVEKDKLEGKGQLAEDDMARLMQYEEDLVRLMKEKEDMVSLLKEKEDMIRLLKEKEDMVRLLKVKEDMGDLNNDKVDRLLKERDDTVVRLTQEKEDMIRMLKEKEDIIRLMKDKEDMVDMKDVTFEDTQRTTDENKDRLLKEKDDVVVRLTKEKDEIVVQLTKEKEDMIRLLKEKEDIIRLMKEKEDRLNLASGKVEDRKQAIDDDRERLIKENNDAISKLTSEKAEIAKLLQEKENLIRLMKEKEHKFDLKKGNVEDIKQSTGVEADRSIKEKGEIIRLTKEKEDYRNTIIKLKQEFESLKSSYEESCKLLESKKEDVVKLVTDKEMNDNIILQLRQELEETKKLHEAETKEEDYRNTIMKLKQEFKSLRSSYEESCKLLESKKEDVVKLVTDKEMTENIILQLRQELEATKKLHEAQTKEEEDYRDTIMKLKQEFESLRSSYEESSKLLESKKEDVVKLVTDKEMNDNIILQLRQELEATKKVHEAETQQLETKAAKVNKEFKQRIKEIELMLEDSTKRRRELEESTESRIQFWKQKEIVVNKFVGLQVKNAQELRLSSVSVRLEVLNCQKRWFEELAGLGQNLKMVTSAAEKYHATLADNRKLFNEIQELKGNIRVYCRIRPFRPWEDEKSTSVEYIGENGELVLSNPAKKGKEAGKNFTFNKVFGPTTTQDMVFKDIQPLIRSVLDGYNVCIFAYGQTGSGKTHTMMGPENATEKEWGVNYRALNDLFNISHDRRDTIKYELGVQMVEIYNEQIRDLLGTGGSQKKLGIQNTTQPNGLAVPDATMCPVDSTSHVIELMQTGHNNRSMSATALNERSSRSHSVVTIHVQGQDLKTGNTLRGALHLVDLAGSERVDRSAVTGDRLKEAQHINKSLAALGDVIFSLSQKNAHVPYRNSKLTQVLQTSLGGHAKTLMFVQVNPDVSSYTETLSTLKFAERVSGVELGVARTNKEGKDVKELMDQLSLLKDTIAKKDDEIDRLQLANSSNSLLKSTKHGDSLLKHSASSPGMTSLGKVASFGSGAASDLDNFSDTSDRHSEAGSMLSTDEARQLGQNFADPGGDSDGRLSDVSDGGIPAGAETDSSVNNVVDQEQEKTSTSGKERLAKAVSRVQKLTVPKVGQASSLRPKPRDPSAPKSSVTTGARKSTTTQATPPARASSTSKRVP
ncbi:kinesin-like protein KIN-14D [Miscanthus floridulus]|uniref:kinesin-like protein KIN-14D n=1 Tax=Miscanthus floridulus TaxID=154761 RepID=UPI00345A2C4E